MTPAEHIAEAERLLVTSYEDGIPLPMGPSDHDVSRAIAHALIAIAVEGGVPHAQPAASQAAQSGPQG